MVNLLSDNLRAKRKPIINDATVEDARVSNIKQQLIATGSAFAGTVLRDCSVGFIRRLEKADLIIAKGQANY